MELNDEKNFILEDSAESSTLAFLINEPEQGTNCATIQKLDYVTPDNSNVFRKKFFISNSEQNEEYDILLLTIEKEKAFLHMAILKDDELLISKEPSNVSYRTLRTENSVTYQEVKYTPNFKRPISIIDPEIADEVKPVLYFDEEANMVRARVKLLPNKSYITLEVQKNETGAFQTNYAICTFE